MNVFQKVIQDIEEFFESGKVEAVFETVAGLVPKALPIVQEIEQLTPNKTVAEVVAAFDKYGVPLEAQIVDNPAAIGNALLNLATTLLEKVEPAAANILQTAVQLAVTAVNAK